MEIIKYEEQYAEQVKDLLVELQEHIALIDKYQLNFVGPEYREKYFKFTIKKDKIFLAVENGVVQGLVVGEIKENYSNLDKTMYACPKQGYVDELVVRKGNRGLGIGQSLLNKIESCFKQEGCKYIQLGVFAYNENARKFYKKNGYEERMLNLIKKVD